MAEALIDVIARLHTVPRRDRYEVSPAIFVKQPIGHHSDAIVLFEEVVDGVAPSAPAYSYVLEVDIAKQVLDLWSSSRAGATPTPAQSVDAVIYYAVNDAYQPTG